MEIFKCNCCGMNYLDERYNKDPMPIYYTHEQYDKGPIKDWTLYINKKLWIKCWCGPYCVAKDLAKDIK